MCWSFPMLNYKYMHFSTNKIQEAILSNSTETVMVRNYQNADCALENEFTVLFVVIFGTLSFPISANNIAVRVAPKNALGAQLPSGLV